MGSFPVAVVRTWSGGGFGAAKALDRGVVLKHNGRRHPAALPVIHSLLASGLLVDTNESGKSHVSAGRGDDSSGLVCVHNEEY